MLTSCGKSPPPERTAPPPPPSASAPVPLDQIDAQGELPHWVGQALSVRPAFKRYRIYTGLNPFYQRGRFDGDTLIDIAIQVVDSASGKRGIVFVHQADWSIHVVGAGEPFGNGGDDFSWLGQWSVADGESLHEPRLKGVEVLYIGKGDSAGGMVWWNGSKYVWTQWGD